MTRVVSTLSSREVPRDGSSVTQVTFANRAADDANVRESDSSTRHESFARSRVMPAANRGTSRQMYVDGDWKLLMRFRLRRRFTPQY